MGNVTIFRKSNLLGARQAGQGMTEYIIIVALIAVAAIGVYSYFGQTLRQQTAGMAAEMSGQSAKTSVDAAQKAAGSASKSAESTKSLSSYGSADDLKGK
jgi:Flp pilus assembly pilin Flp